MTLPHQSDLDTAMADPEWPIGSATLRDFLADHQETPEGYCTCDAGLWAVPCPHVRLIVAALGILRASEPALPVADDLSED
jgi:hypothetical protein